MELINMACDEEGDYPYYPYGLCIRLENDELEKLNIMLMPKVGEEYRLMAIASVSSVSQEVGGGDRSLTLQIVRMNVSQAEPSDPIEAKTGGPKTVMSYYGGRE